MKKPLFLLFVTGATAALAYLVFSSHHFSHHENEHHAHRSPKTEGEHKPVGVIREENEKRFIAIEEGRDEIDRLRMSNRKSLEKVVALQQSNQYKNAMEQVAKAHESGYRELIRPWGLDPQTADRVVQVVLERESKESDAHRKFNLAKHDGTKMDDTIEAELIRVESEAAKELESIVGKERTEQLLFAEENILGFHTPYEVRRAASLARLKSQLEATKE